MWVALIIVHVLVGLALILIVLLQTGKGAEMGAAFGGSSQTLFGSAGPGTFLGKLTTGAAVIFMCTSLTLAVMSSGKRGEGSIMTGAGKTQTERPAAPAAPPAMPTGQPQGRPAAPPAPAQSAPAAPQQPAAKR
jgi:preprotein translocase subunit SecG